MERLNRLVVDSSDAITDLCTLGVQYPTDKSPYSKADWLPIRHPYTAIYDLIFSQRRYDPLVIGETGIYYNMSTHIWRQYFPRATIYGWDVNPKSIENALSHHLCRCQYGIVDMNNPQSVYAALNDCKTEFDVLIDDSSHLFEHQLTFMRVAFRFLKPGGVLIVEDVKGEYGEDRFREELRPIYPYFASGMFVEAKHQNTNNTDDRMIVLFRNQVPAPSFNIFPPVTESPLLTEARERLTP